MALYGREGRELTREEGVPKYVLHTRTPCIVPELLEGVQEAGSGKRYFVGAHAAERVVAIWLVGVRRIEVTQVSSPIAGYRQGQALDEIAVRVDDGDAASALYVLERQSLEEGRLPRSGSSDHVHMMQAIGLLDTEGTVGIPGVGDREIGNALRIDHLLIV